MPNVTHTNFSPVLTVEQFLAWDAATITVSSATQIFLTVSSGPTSAAATTGNYRLVLGGAFTNTAGVITGTVNSITGRNETGTLALGGISNFSLSLAQFGFDFPNIASKPSVTAFMSGNDTLTGGNARDTLFGYAGNDTINGGLESDTLNGGNGADTINGGAGDDLITGGNGADILNGGADDDRYFYSAQSHAVAGESIADPFANDFDRIVLTTSIDFTKVDISFIAALNFGHSSGAATATVLGRQIGNNPNIVETRIHTIEGASAALGRTDRLVIVMEDAHPVLDLSHMAFTGWTRGTDLITIIGTTLGETITGSREHETIEGNGGNDTITGGGGIDVLRGGAGRDTFRLNTLAMTSAQLGQNFLSIDGGDDEDTLNLSFSSTSAASLFDFTTGVEIESIERILFSSAGDPKLVQPATASLFMHQFDGTSLQDVTGSAAAEHLVLEWTLLTLNFSLAATNFANWEQGTDTLTIDLRGASGDGTNYTGASAGETVIGSIFDDVVSTLGGRDVLDGGQGNDTMIGGDGNDVYYVDSTSDIVTETNADPAIGGIDRIYSSVTRTLGANVELLNLTGAAAINGTGNDLANTLVGNGANNLLNGLGNNDVLNGAGSNDVLVGGLGNDTMTGGTGLDAFLFNTALDATTNVDTITDFSAADDTIRLENAIFTALTVTGTLAEAAFKANASGVATDADDRILYNRLTGALSYDANGNAAGGAIQFATLSTKPNITAADFLVV